MVSVLRQVGGKYVPVGPGCLGGASWGQTALGRRPLRTVVAPGDTRAEEGRRPGLLGPLDPPASTHLPGPSRISPRFLDPPGPPAAPRISLRSPDLPRPSPLLGLPPSPALSRSPGLPAHLSPSRCESPALPAPGALARVEAAGCVRGQAEWLWLTPGELCGAWSAVGPGRRALAGGRGPEGTVRVGPTWALPPPTRPDREEARGAPAAPPLGGGQHSGVGGGGPCSADSGGGWERRRGRGGAGVRSPAGPRWGRPVSP